jgi:hypothetical protein
MAQRIIRFPRAFGAAVLAGLLVPQNAECSRPHDGATSSPSHVQRAPLGVNIGQVNNYHSQIAFLDLVKQAPDWALGSDGYPPSVDAHGLATSLAPGHEAGFIVNTGQGGRYVALYEGDGEVGIGQGGRVVKRAPGRVEMELEGGAAHIRLLRTNPSNPLRKLSIVPIAYERNHSQRIFQPRFLEIVRPFGVLRFHDWLRVIDSTQARWEDRPTPDDFSQGTAKGVALEYAIELCNRVRADCWLNIPHMADDDYVTHYAEMVRDHLDAPLSVYVEYSNEIWNYAHGDWCQQAGERLGMPRGWDTRLRYQAHRSIEIFEIFERVVGRGRLVRVLASQSVERRIRILAEWEGAYRHADAIAIAPYFCDELASDENVPKIRHLDAADVAAQCVADVERVRERVRKARAQAARLGLPLIGYEGGQHLVTSPAYHQDAALQRLLDEANRHPNMGRAYARYLDMWREEGGGLLMLYKLVYAPAKWGRWGLLETMWQPFEAAPKYRAAVEFIERWNPRAGMNP